MNTKQNINSKSFNNDYNLYSYLCSIKSLNKPGNKRVKNSYQKITIVTEY